MLLHRSADRAESFDAVDGLRAEDALAPGRIARLLARLRGRALDRTLSDGADPSASPQLAARAAALTARPMREEIAQGLERVVWSVQQPPSRLRVPLRRTPVLINAQQLHELASALHGPAPVYARGVAMLHELLTDGTGPLYAARSQQLGLAQVLHNARAALLDYAAPAASARS